MRASHKSRVRRLGNENMKGYVITTGLAFALLELSHVLRVAQEGTRLLREPWFLLINALALAFAIWAAWLALPRRAH
jgi:hypothetical protein